MIDVMAISLQSLQNDAMRLDRTGVNLANAMTPGFKREVLVQRAAFAATSFASLVEQQAIAGSRAVANRSPAAFGVERDMRVGTLKSTAQPFDFALTGPGFLEVSTPTGPAYTRHGQFQIDSRGRVVTQQGYPVMGVGGEVVLNGTPSVDSSGAFTEDGRVVNKLRIVDFPASEKLERLEGGLYAAGKQPSLVNENASEVRQGYLENANVDTTREMVDLIRTMRHAESMQRVVQGYDDLLGTAIRKLGDL
jgi:flagellar basal-body rod protein FlgG